MLSMIKKVMYSSCMVMLGIAMNPNGCLANIEPAQIYPETAWISLDLPKEMKDKVDIILAESYQQRKNIWSNQDSSVAYGFNELSSNEDFNKINRIKQESAEKMMALLSGEEKTSIENKLKECSQLAEETLLMILDLNLSIKQQEMITHSLLEDQQRVAGIVANQALSWEERRTKLKEPDVLARISFVLDKEQLKIVTEWDKSLINNKRNQLMVKK